MQRAQQNTGATNGNSNALCYKVDFVSTFLEKLQVW